MTQPATAAEDKSIRPFQFTAPEEELVDLRRRIAATRWPEQETVSDQSQAYPNLIYYNKLDKGGHFAAWEQPQIFSEEVRAAFRSLR